jgi:hypothetical protein
MTDEAKKLLRRTSDEIRATSDPSQSLMDLACDIDAFLSRPEPAAPEPVYWEPPADWLKDHEIPPMGSVLQKLGSRLSDLLQEDDWNNVEQMLFDVARETAPPQAPSDEMRQLALNDLYEFQNLTGCDCPEQLREKMMQAPSDAPVPVARVVGREDPFGSGEDHLLVIAHPTNARLRLELPEDTMLYLGPQAYAPLFTGDLVADSGERLGRGRVLAAPQHAEDGAQDGADGQHDEA